MVLRLDGTGVGQPIVEWARRLLPGLPIRAEVFTAEGKRTMMENLAVLLERRILAIPDDRDLVDELLSFVERPSGRLEGAGDHDDLVCALALAAKELAQPHLCALLGDRRRD